MFLAAPISSRNQFATLLNERGLTGTAVEVGTHQGDFAHQFIKDWRGARLHCVDPWENSPDYVDQAKRLWGDGDREKDYRTAAAKLRRYGRQAHLMRMTSLAASYLFDNGTLDFVHLDGNHEPPYVEEDIRLWWPKLKKGGILAGHDIVCPGEANGSWGRYIQPAVIAFMKANDDIAVQLVVEENGLPWSYFVVKP